MKERPILFSGPMVRAILEGRKIQTRRAIKPQPTNMEDDRRRMSVLSDAFAKYGRCGDRLWVRETLSRSDNGTLIYNADQCPVMYDGESEKTNIKKKIPSIFMPRWASRITLEITSIRVERVQDISEEDASAEGCTGKDMRTFCDPSAESILPADEYACLWDSINAKRGNSWDSNPWVWVIEFKRIEEN